MKFVIMMILSIFVVLTVFGCQPVNGNEGPKAPPTHPPKVEDCHYFFNKADPDDRNSLYARVWLKKAEICYKYVNQKECPNGR